MRKGQYTYQTASTHTIKIAIITTVYTLTSPSLYAAEPDEIRASTD